MSKKEVQEKYQISDREFIELKSANDTFCRALVNGSNYFSISKIREMEKLDDEISILEQEKENAKLEHENKSFMARSFGTPRSVGFIPSNYDKDRARDAAATVFEAENDFKYLCQAHRLSASQAFKDLLPFYQDYAGYSRDREKAADAFRGYEHAKSSSIFSGIFR